MSLITADNLNKFYNGLHSKSVFFIDFVDASEGDHYSITSENESYSGELGSDLQLVQTVKELNTTYRVSVVHSGSTYYVDVEVGKYYGSYDITVEASLLYSITVNHNPTKTTFDAGDFLDTSGLSIAAIYVNETILDVTDDCTFSISPNRRLTENDTSYTVSYTESGVTRTVTINITVNPATTDIELVETLEAGETEVTFEDNSIVSNKRIDLYTSKEGLDYISLDTSVSNTVIVQYPEQESDVSVKLVIH